MCPNVSTEPQLQPLTGEQLNTAANTEEAARLDVKARGFWCNDGKDAFFDIRVFHPHASSYQNTELPRLYRQHERAKKSKYARRRRVAEIEHGCFTPLVFTTSWGMAPEATTFFRRLAGPVSEKRGSSYSATMNWIRCCLFFSLLRSSLLCIRGSRSTQRTFCNTCSVQCCAHRCWVPTVTPFLFWDFLMKTFRIYLSWIVFPLCFTHPVLFQHAPTFSLTHAIWLRLRLHVYG